MKFIDKILKEALVNNEATAPEQSQGRGTNIIRQVSEEEYNEKFQHMPDTREQVGEGDLCFGFWIGNDCCIFTAAKLPYPEEGDAGLGIFTEHDYGDIANAYHVVVLEKGQKSGLTELVDRKSAFTAEDVYDPEGWDDGTITRRFKDNFDNTVEVRIIPVPGQRGPRKDYEIHFNINGKYVARDENGVKAAESDFKNYIKILNTVSLIAKEFIADYNPASLVVSSDASFDKDMDKKMKIYKAIADKMNTSGKFNVVLGHDGHGYVTMQILPK